MEIIHEWGTVFLAMAVIFGLYMTWGIGANDVANAMGTSVGSGAITVKQAIVIAAIFEFAGAFIAGGSVTKTIRKGIIDPGPITANPELLVYGMLAALLAAACGVPPEEAEAIYKLTALASMDERVVVPPAQREMAVEMLDDPLDYKKSMGFGFRAAPTRGG